MHKLVFKCLDDIWHKRHIVIKPFDSFDDYKIQLERVPKMVINHRYLVNKKKQGEKDLCRVECYGQTVWHTEVTDYRKVSVIEIL